MRTKMRKTRKHHAKTKRTDVHLTLREEVMLLRSAVIGLVGKDDEGEYRPEFVREVFKDLKRKPTLTFTTPEKFLEDVERA